MNLTVRCRSLRTRNVSAVCLELLQSARRRSPSPSQWLLAACLVLAGLPGSDGAVFSCPAADAVLPGAAVMPLRSGPEAGTAIRSFFVRAVTGPHRNRSVCYVCRYGSRPVVAVFLQGVDPDVPRLLKAIDTFVDRNRISGLRSFGVLVTDDSASAVSILQTLAFDERIRMPLTASTTTIAGREVMHLHREAATTLVLYRQQRAVSTLAFAKGAIDDAAVAGTVAQLQALIDSEDGDRIRRR